MKKYTVLLLFLLNISCKKVKEIKNKEEAKIPVTVINPVRGDMDLKITLSGKVEGIPDVLVYTRVPGYYYKKLKKEGEFVKKGEVILLLERREFGLKFEPVKIEAPVSGRISYFKYDIGEFIPPNKPLARIFGDKKYKIKLSLPSDYAKHIKKGKVVKVIIDSLIYKGVINDVSYASDPFTGNFNFEVIFKPSTKILPGTPCEVRLSVLRKKNILKLPARCVLGTAKRFVFVVKNGVARRVPVITGIESDGYIEIIKGLNENDTVVFKGTEVLKEGDKVEIIKGG